MIIFYGNAHDTIFHHSKSLTYHHFNKKKKHFTIPNYTTEIPLTKIPSHIFLFQYTEILEDYLHPNLIHPITRRRLQLDIFVPRLQLAFEYQGQQHYHDMQFFGSVVQRQEIDIEKRSLCSNKGISLIDVPYWYVVENLLKRIFFCELLRNC